MDTGLLPRLHPRKSPSVSWRFFDPDNESAGHKEGFDPNFPNFPAVRPKAKFFEPRQIWYQNAPAEAPADHESKNGCRGRGDKLVLIEEINK